jgi:uncharacterized protein (TIGR01619 family)
MSSHWDFYFFVVDGKPCSTMLDLGLVTLAPIANRPWLLCVRIPLLKPRADGLTDNTEAEELGKLEEAFQRSICVSCDAQFVGRMTWNGTRDLFFYARSTETFAQAMQSAWGTLPPRRVMTQVREDKEWLHYLEVLFPGPIEQRWMADRRVVEELKKAGDRVEQARVIDHSANFPSERQAQAFASECRTLGFEMQVRATDHGSAWSVQASRVDVAELLHVHEIVANLQTLAEECGGKYEGWGCAVVRETDA